MSDETTKDAEKNLTLHDDTPEAAADDRDTNGPDPETPEAPPEQPQPSAQDQLQNDIAAALDKAMERGITVNQVAGALESVKFGVLFSHNADRLSQMMMKAQMQNPQILVPNGPAPQG